MSEKLHVSERFKKGGLRTTAGLLLAASALSGFTFSFWLLAGAGVFLLLISPLINRLMHGVR